MVAHETFTNAKTIYNSLFLWRFSTFTRSPADEHILRHDSWDGNIILNYIFIKCDVQVYL